MTPDFQLFVKPVGALCNLGCSYCYYLSKQGISSEKQPLMTDELLESYIIQHLQISNEETVMFSWHGGEPTLASLGFFQKVVAIQRRHNMSKKRVINGIQTNGINLNEEWCRFFAEENFVVGISIDGPEALHNKYRVSKSGEASFQKVIAGYNQLKKYPIPTEILCVVNAHNVNYPLEVYRFLKSLGTRYISFLPLVNQDINSATKVTLDSVPASSFGDFLIAIFNEWQDQDIGSIQIQLFEEAFRQAFKLEHTLCVFKKTCGKVPVLEQNGDFYSCDHFVDKGHLIGNIHDSNLSTLLSDTRQIAFGEAKYNTLPGYCLQCEVLGMCHGECPKNRFIQTPGGENGLNYLCEGYRKFFNHCAPFVNTLVEIIGFEES